MAAPGDLGSIGLSSLSCPHIGQRNSEIAIGRCGRNGNRTATPIAKSAYHQKTEWVMTQCPIRFAFADGDSSFWSACDRFQRRIADWFPIGRLGNSGDQLS